MNQTKSELQSMSKNAIVEKEKTNFDVGIYQTDDGREPFTEWLDSLDNSVSGRVIARVDRLKFGLFGKSKTLKNGIFELKFRSPPFRIYYFFANKKKIVLILGGSKSFQSRDIKQAKEYLEDYRSRYENEE